MAYPQAFALSLGSSQTGLTLKAQLVNTVGANVGAEITSGFTEIGVGNYLWYSAAIPDDHVGGVKFLTTGGVLKAFCSINPQELEYADAKVSTRTKPADTQARVTLVDTLTTYTGNTPQTGDSFARLGAPAGASHAVDTAAVKADTAAVKIQTDKLTFTVANQIDANVIDWKSATAPAMTGDAFARLGAPAGASIAADLAEIEAETDDIAAVKAKTDSLPSDPADASDIASSFSTVNATLATLSGYVDTEVAAIKAKTDNLPASPAAVGDAMTLTPAYDLAKTAAQAGDEMTLTSGERNAVATALLDLADAIEAGVPLRKALRYILAESAGKLSGAQTDTNRFRNAVADTKDRLVATVDADGNRTAISYDGD